ncbi:TlpA family protein disulfide reductase [Halobellus rarus]|uniref:TlpA family protein disulfide reductase n=1 Tax=Halobellus rarus TaxID=1126237 RepID=A0ABD6CRF5_9EURY|nr:TlpA disulfide reductase family protein [Halobellus rarus]
MPSSNRREFLATISTGFGVSLTGCAGQLSTTTTTSQSTTDTTAENNKTDTSSRLALPSVVTHDEFPDGEVVLKPDGKIVLLNFFATWCRPCQEEMPEFRKLRAAYDTATLHMVSITPEVDEGLIKQFWDEYEGTWPVVKDPGLVATDRWNANSYPTNLVFDSDGTPVSGDEPEVRARTFEDFKSVIEPLLEA